GARRRPWARRPSRPGRRPRSGDSRRPPHRGRRRTRDRGRDLARGYNERPAGFGAPGHDASRRGGVGSPVQCPRRSQGRRPRRGVVMTADLLTGEPEVVATGVDLFTEALTAQAVSTTAVEWRPPLPGTEEELVRAAADPRRHEANTRALERMMRSTAELVDVRPARESLGLQ